MAKKSFLLVSLKEKKAKKLAEVISNKTCRRILDLLSERKDASESEIAKELEIPISTVHYNMKALLAAKLVKVDEYHYSSKGKEVNHYKLANQFVIIAPEGAKEGIKEKLKSLIPTALVMGGAAALIKIFNGFGLGRFNSVDKLSAPMASPMIAKDVAVGGMGTVMDVAKEEVVNYATQSSGEILEATVDDGAQEVFQEGARSLKTFATDTVNSVTPTQNAGGEVAHKALIETQNAMVEKSPETINHISTNTDRLPEAWNYCSNHIPEIALWFLAGAVVGVGVYVLIEYLRKRYGR